MTTSRRTLLVVPGIAATVALVAACTPQEQGGIPITGTLHYASAGTAPLTLEDQVLGTGLSMSATLDGEPVTGSGTWACYAPFPPEYPNYDLDARDSQTFGFFLSIDPMAWSTGAHAIDGELVHLLVASPDRYGIAETGTIFITKAGTVPGAPGNDCGYSITGPIALRGEKDR